METKYINENGLVYKEDAHETFTNRALVGPAEKVVTVRVDNKTVEDVTYLFDLGAGDYVEKSRVTRDEPEVVTKTEIEQQPDKISQLEAENKELKARLTGIELAFAKLMKQEEVEPSA